MSATCLTSALTGLVESVPTGESRRTWSRCSTQPLRASVGRLTLATLVRVVLGAIAPGACWPARVRRSAAAFATLRSAPASCPSSFPGATPSCLAAATGEDDASCSGWIADLRRDSSWWRVSVAAGGCCALATRLFRVPRPSSSAPEGDHASENCSQPPKDLLIGRRRSGSSVRSLECAYVGVVVALVLVRQRCDRGADDGGGVAA
jgi:hypothetical protein